MIFVGIGIFVAGVLFGALLMALMVAASDDDDREGRG